MRYFILILLTVSTICNAQNFQTKSKKAKALFTEAETNYVKGNFTEALIIVNKAIDKDSKFIDAYLLKAEIAQMMQKYEIQKEVLIKALSIDSTYFIPTYFNIGKSEFNLGNYDEALLWFKQYALKPGSLKRSINTKEWIKKAEFAREAIKSNREITPKNLGSTVNSKYDEYWPSLTADEQTLVFTVMVPKDTNAFNNGSLPKLSVYFQEDFYISKCFDYETWSMREAINPPLNTDQNEGAQSLSADGKWMFFTGCGKSGSVGSCDIYFSQRLEEGWTNPVNLGTSLNSPYWESQPSFSSDGQTLYFVSNRIGGFGGRDIYSATIVTSKDDGTPIFGNVTNLGPSINTNKNENSPFIHPDNKTLYFSSGGWPGMGEMDIFYSRYDEHKGWTKAINIGYPINSNKDEIGFIVNAKGDMAYYSSDGLPGSFGGKDIYTFELPNDVRPTPVSYVKGYVYDEETKKRISAKFELLSLRTGELIATTKATKYSGQFLICLPPGENYAFNVSKPGYMFYSDNFNLTEIHDATQPKQIDIYLKPIKTGEQIVLKNVFYATDSYELKEESKIELNKIVQFLKENGDVKIEVQGHTDNVGSAVYNTNLSQKRANEVVTHLIFNGISQSRLTSKGYGYIQPIDTNETEDGRANNRRTEMKIVE